MDAPIITVPAPGKKSSKFIMALIIIAIIIVIVCAVMFTYRHYFEFNNTEVKRLINDEAQKYGSNQMAVNKIISEGVQYILDSPRLTKQVRHMSKSGVSKERALVDAAIAQCIAFKYLKP